jgi:hypothetical protein
MSLAMQRETHEEVRHAEGIQCQICVNEEENFPNEVILVNETHTCRSDEVYKLEKH